jgi:predicted Zn-dependent protease
MKNFLIAFLPLLFCIAAPGQSMEEARKMLYYERYKSAIKILEPMANGSNAEAAYWLGEAYLMMPKPEIEKARAVINKAFLTNAGNGMLNAAAGQIALREDKPDIAKAKFTAAEQAGAKNADVLLAVARAATDAKTGDNNYQYAISIINKALEIKKVNKPVAYIILGNAYRKLFEGGEADKSYRNALDADPKNAMAYLRLGKIYQTQRNDEIMLENFNKAVQVDPLYAPAWLALYDHFSYRDVDKAKTYLDKYIANSDADCNTELFAADYLFRSGKYNDALSKSAQLAGGPCNAEIGLRLKVLNAYSYSRLKDSVNAKKEIDAFMMQEKPGNILGTDYQVAAKILTAFPGSELKAIEYYNKAMETDTAGRVGYLLQVIDLYKKINDGPKVAASWERMFKLKPRPSNLDMYNRALSYMAINNYAYADSLWQQYKEKYPDQVYGYANRIKCNEALDTSTTMPLGLAVPHWENMVAFANRDTVKYKSQLVNSLYKLVVYNVNIKKDLPKGKEYLTQYLLFDPSNEEAKKLLLKLK